MNQWRWLLAVTLIVVGLGWLVFLSSSAAVPSLQPILVEQLSSGAVARLDSPVFTYSPGWQVAALGADPAEPADPFTQPAGVISFTYRAAIEQGAVLALQLATGNYWGYLYITVDDQPANLLPLIAGNLDSRAMLAGYKPLYEPENGGTGRWVRVHQSNGDSAEHLVRIEVWRSWGQTPIRAVAVDALPVAPRPLWPGVGLILLGLGVVGKGRQGDRETGRQGDKETGRQGDRETGRRGDGETGRRGDGETGRRGDGETGRQGDWETGRLGDWEMGRQGDGETGRQGEGIAVALGIGVIGFVLAAAGVGLEIWWLCLAGVGLLAAVGFFHPVLWLAAFLLALPFYFGFNLPLLAGRSFGIIDVGVFGGALITIANLLISQSPNSQSPISEIVSLRDWKINFRLSPLLWLLVGWALVATFAADHFAVALREWRTVFLAAAVFAVLLNYVLRPSPPPPALRLPPSAFRLPPPALRLPPSALRTPHSAFLLSAWLVGATLVALIGIWAVLTRYEPYLMGAEGVLRLRSVYGSPNNLAAYLERTLAVSLALLLFAPQLRVKILAGIAAIPQAAALLLTFSKGGIFLGLPAMLLVLGIGGVVSLRRQGRSLRLLWWLAVIGGIVALALLPVIGTERFRGLFDPNSATSLMRINLWRSAWQMGIDHWLLGVGPDNFLYTYRSEYLLPAAWKEPDLNHPHNFILDWWTRLGVLGLLLGLIWWGRIVGNVGGWGDGEKGGKGERENPHSAFRPPHSALQLGLLAAVAASLAHGLIDISYALPDLMIVWVLIESLGSGEPLRRSKNEEVRGKW